MQSRAAYILYFFTLSKSVHQAQSFLGYVLLINSLFTFYSLPHHVYIRHRRGYDEQKAAIVV